MTATDGDRKEPTPTTPHVWDWNIRSQEAVLIETVWIGGHDIDEECVHVPDTGVRQDLEVEVYYPIEKMNAVRGVGGLSSLFEPEERSEELQGGLKSLLCLGMAIFSPWHPRGTADTPIPHIDRASS